MKPHRRAHAGGVHGIGGFEVRKNMEGTLSLWSRECKAILAGHTALRQRTGIFNSYSRVADQRKPDRRRRALSALNY